MAAFWDFATWFGPIVSAVMGAVVTLFPDLAKRRAWVWIPAFVVVAALTAIGTREGQKVLEVELTGGDNFPIVNGLVLAPNMSMYSLVIANLKETPLFDVRYSVCGPFPDDLPVQDLNYRQQNPLFAKPVGTLIDWFTIGTVPAGTYTVYMKARNGVFTETLYLPPKWPGNAFAIYRFGKPTPLKCEPASFCPGDRNDFDAFTVPSGF